MNPALTYEEREAEERRRAAEATAKIKAVIFQLGFTLNESDPGSRSYWRAHEVTKPRDGLSLSFSQEKDRIYIGASYPRTKRGEYVRPVGYNEAMKDRISVSLAKSAENIARDVKGRLLPVALEYLKRVTDQIAKTDDYYDTTESTLEALKGAPLDEFEKRSSTIRLRDIDCEIRASRGEVHLEAGGLDLPLARVILSLLRNPHPVAHVGAEIADAFGMRDLPNVVVEGDDKTIRA